MDSSPFIDARAVSPVRWKNGGGATRELAQKPAPEGFAWRLSLADVEANGAFSIFPGMSRILTVIEGDRLELHSPNETFDVPLGEPFHFSGETEIHSALRNGKICNFNVIFDPSLVEACVTVETGPTRLNLTPTIQGCIAIFGIFGEFNCNGVLVRKGSFAMFETGNLTITLPNSSCLLVVQLKARKPL